MQYTRCNTPANANAPAALYKQSSTTPSPDDAMFAIYKFSNQIISAIKITNVVININIDLSESASLKSSSYRRMLPSRWHWNGTTCSKCRRWRLLKWTHLEFVLDELLYIRIVSSILNCRRHFGQLTSGNTDCSHRYRQSLQNKWPQGVVVALFKIERQMPHE